MKFTFKTEIIPIIIILISVGLGFYFYSIFPETVPVHWGANGEVDRWGNKFEGSWLMPLIAIGMYTFTHLQSNRANTNPKQKIISPLPQY